MASVSAELSYAAIYKQDPNAGNSRSATRSAYIVIIIIIMQRLTRHVSVIRITNHKCKIYIPYKKQEERHRMFTKTILLRDKANDKQDVTKGFIGQLCALTGTQYQDWGQSVSVETTRQYV